MLQVSSVQVIETAAECEAALQRLQWLTRDKVTVLGLDCEWVPPNIVKQLLSRPVADSGVTALEQQSYKKVALLQLSDGVHTLLIRLNCLLTEASRERAETAHGPNNSNDPITANPVCMSLRALLADPAIFKVSLSLSLSFSLSTSERAARDSMSRNETRQLCVDCALD